MNTYFETKIEYNGIYFCLTNKPTVDEREIHPYHEILLYIRGDAELLMKEGRRKICDNSLILIPRESYHFFRLSEKTEFLRLKISFSEDAAALTPLSSIMRGIRIIEVGDGSIALAFERLCMSLREESEKTGFYAYAAFLTLVCELDMRDVGEESFLCKKSSSILADVMEYICENPSKDLSIRALSEIFHISESGISHLFKKEFGISIHKYIIQKRLLFARTLMANGASPTAIFAEAGFGDYSSFYKAYIKYFGSLPSKMS